MDTTDSTKYLPSGSLIRTGQIMPHGIWSSSFRQPQRYQVRGNGTAILKG
jgi:hypothetical protein